jgi:hypothetical protein
MNFNLDHVYDGMSTLNLATSILTRSLRISSAYFDIKSASYPSNDRLFALLVVRGWTSNAVVDRKMSLASTYTCLLTNIKFPDESTPWMAMIPSSLSWYETASSLPRFTDGLCASLSAKHVVRVLWLREQCMHSPSLRPSSTCIVCLECVWLA